MGHPLSIPPGTSGFPLLILQLILFRLILSFPAIRLPSQSNDDRRPVNQSFNRFYLLISALDRIRTCKYGLQMTLRNVADRIFVKTPFFTCLFQLGYKGKKRLIFMSYLTSDPNGTRTHDLLRDRQASYSSRL